MNQAFDINRAIKDCAFAVIDLETTGLYPDRGDRICEIAILEISPGKPPKEWHCLLQPLRGMSPGATAVSGITDEMLASASTFAAAAPDIWRRLDGRILVAHNAPFDVGFLRSELLPLGYAIESLFVVDTLVLARRYYPEERHDLPEIARRLGVDPGLSHRALGDARTTAGIFEHFAQRLGADGGRIAELLPRPADCQLTSPDPFGRVLLTIEKALESQADLAIRYYSPWTACTTQRTVEPKGLFDDYYMEAFCHLRGGVRRFRIDRIRDAALVAAQREAPCVVA
ncbi:MAG: 3'-5' exonuclease [Acidobacteriota bacterium]